jgi:hypothetical protein
MSATRKASGTERKAKKNPPGLHHFLAGMLRLKGSVSSIRRAAKPSGWCVVERLRQRRAQPPMRLPFHREVTPALRAMAPAQTPYQGSRCSASNKRIAVNLRLSPQE